MKLLDAIKNLRVDNLGYLKNIRIALEMRLDWLSFREPESDGMVHDEWSEKYDDLEEIFDLAEELEEEKDEEKMKDLIEEIQELTVTYQLIHGGLSRLKI